MTSCCVPTSGRIRLSFVERLLQIVTAQALHYVVSEMRKVKGRLLELFDCVVLSRLKAGSPVTLSHASAEQSYKSRWGTGHRRVTAAADATPTSWEHPSEARVLPPPPDPRRPNIMPAAR